MKKTNDRYFPEADVQYSEKLHELHTDVLFLPERMKIEQFEKLVANLHDKTENVMHIINLNQALNHKLVFKKFHRVIKSNQNAWLKPYIDMNTDLRKKRKNYFEKNFFKSINNAASEKPMENVTQHRRINLVTTKRRRTYLVSEPSYHTTKIFTKNLLAIEMKRKAEILMDKPVCSRLSILKLIKLLMHQFWYDYVKLKYGKKAKLCHMDGYFIVYIRTDDIYKNIAEDFKTRFDTTNYELDRPSPEGKTKKLIGLMKDELNGKIMTKFVGLRAKAYSYLIGDGSEDKESKNYKNLCYI